METQNIISISESQRVFTLGEARSLLPVIYHMTEAAQKVVRTDLNRLEAAKNGNAPMVKSLELEIQSEVEKWQAKVEKLGGVAKGMWLVDFDNGQGYFCWKFPETDILHSHGYNDGYTGRKAIL